MDELELFYYRVLSELEKTKGKRSYKERTIFDWKGKLLRRKLEIGWNTKQKNSYAFDPTKSLAISLSSFYYKGNLHVNKSCQVLTSLSVEYMQDKSRAVYNEWDFDSVWEMQAGGLPTLRGVSNK